MRNIDINSSYILLYFRYLKRVRREMEEVEKLIKLLRTPVEALVDFYKSLFPETHSDKVLARILQLKVCISSNFPLLILG